MNRRWICLLLMLFCLLAFPSRSPAPLIYRPGEGWSYEPVGGGGKWQRARAKDQLEVAQTAFEKKDYSLALRAARRVVRVWPLSDYAPRAQYLVGRCYEAKGRDEKAFQEYQNVLEKQPKIDNYDEILQRQFNIANQYLAGKWFKLWGVIPIFSSMDKTASMYEKIVKNGAYSEVAPQAQMKIGAAREKQKNYAVAAKAYEMAADRYHDRPQLAADAVYRQGLCYKQEAQTAEYDQNTASQAIATFTDFMTLYPGDKRVAEAQKIIVGLKTEQARGDFEIAKFYEKYKKWNGALVYYNEVLLQDPNSQYATQARMRIDELKKRTLPATN
ncbi:MAG TPA: outer membrane protein assembly factor BamD [Verrucomicrobiae bacterium]|nr:outer membrane protein assembly factor BamD [Verrucomicrobiae bacterium]